MPGPARTRLVHHAIIAAALLILAGIAAAELNLYGAAFLGSPEHHAIPVQLIGGRPAASAGPSDTLSFLAQPRPVPEIHFVDGNGRAMTLADFRGRVILLNVWATWCVPCRKEMPALDRLQATLGSPDFQVVPLSIDRQGVAVVTPFYRKLGIEALGIYIDRTGDATQALKTIGVPTSVLIDRDGREIARKMGAAAWDSPKMIDLIRRHIEPRHAAMRRGNVVGDPS